MKDGNSREHAPHAYTFTFAPFIIISSDQEKESWTIDQITKSELFHQKLHEWGLLEIAYELESI